jgi:2-dehydropantoate 2-reductase
MNKEYTYKYAYGIVGNGRASGHLQAYLNLLKIPFTLWHKKLKTSPEKILESSTLIFILINDSQIKSFIKSHPFLKKKTLIHFSASLNTRLAVSMHPFMALSRRKLSLSDYQKIPFIITENKAFIKKLLPKFKNHFIKIPTKKKNFYHALCVMGANFPIILWDKVFKDLNHKFQIPKKDIFNYFKASLDNFIENPNKALTGPLQRKDTTTMTANLNSLKNDPFKDVYLAFKKTHLNNQRKK